MLVWHEGFEQAASIRRPSQALSPDGWLDSEAAAPEDCTVRVVTDPVAEGTHALRLEPRKQFCMFVRDDRWPRVEPSTVYTMSIKVMFDTKGGPGGLGMVRDKTGADCRVVEDHCRPETAPRSGGFKEFGFTFMTGPAQRRLVQPRVYVEPMPQGGVYLDDIRIVEGGTYAPQGLDMPVPIDRVLPARYRLDLPTAEALAAQFGQLHLESERTYRGNGQWEGYLQLTEGYRQKHGLDRPSLLVDHPLLRSTTQRIFGYLGACAATAEPVYAQRAKEGLDWLLTEQQADGGFLWYGTEQGTAGDYYETGLAGAALVDGYLHFGDARYLDAARRVAVYARDIERSWNVNYNMFLVWAAARHAVVTGDLALLEPILSSDKFRLALDLQRAWGGWSGHNSRIGYHGINLRGYLAAYQALPDTPEHATLRADLRAAVIAGINRYVVEQCPHGGLPFERGKPETARANGSIMFALIMANQVLGLDTRALVNGVLHFYATPRARGDMPYWSVLALLEAAGQYMAWAGG